MKDATRTRLLSVLALVVLFALLVPMLAIGRYDAPQLDDFLYGKEAETAWALTHSVSAALAAGAGTAARLFYEWQGTYSATFLMSVHPGIWGVQYYCAVPYILIGALLASLFLFCWVIGKRLFTCTKAERLLLFAIFAILCTQFVPSPVQAFYWFNGAIFYTFYFSLTLIFFALLTAFYYRVPHKKGNIVYYILLPLLAAFIAGGNYSTGLEFALVLAVCVGWQFAAKKSRNLLPVLALAIFLALFILSLTAPGNSIHQTQPGGLMTAVRAGVKALLKTWRSIVKWTTLPVLAATFFCVPLAWRAAERTAFRFRFPPLVMAASLLLLASGFVPTLYTQDYTGSDRLMDIQYYLHILLLFINIFYCAGWLKKRMGSIAAPRAARAIAAVLALAVLIGSYDAFVSFAAVGSLLSGEAKGYRAEVAARTVILEDPAVTDVVLPPLKNRPALLLVADYGENAYDEWNQVVGCSYYEKNSLRVSEEVSD